MPADWASNVPCEGTSEKRIPLPLMGRIPKAYPSYSEILESQLGDGSFGSMTAGEEGISESRKSPVEKGGTPGDGSVEGTIDKVSDDLPSKKRRRKKKRTPKEAKVDFDDGRKMGSEINRPWTIDRSTRRMKFARRTRWTVPKT